MSLLDTGPETLLLRPSTRTTDPDGNSVLRSWRPGDAEYTVTGAQVEPASSDTETVSGQRIEADVTAMFRRLPEGVSGEYLRVLWDGREFHTVGSPRAARRGRGTRHVRLDLVEVR